MTSGRVRALTRNPRKMEAIAKGALPAIVRQMELHLEAGKEYLSIPHHKVPSTYNPTYRYQDSWVASPIRDTTSGLVGTLSNDVRDSRGRAYAVFVAGTESEESEQAGDWLGDWNQLRDALRDLPGQPSFRDRITKTIRELTRNA